jgi:hypothetical protein
MVVFNKINYIWTVVFWPLSPSGVERVKFTKVKSKVTLSRYPYTGTKGESRYSFYSFLTSSLCDDEFSASRPGRALPPGIDPRYPLDRRLGVPQSWSGHRG